MKNLFNMNVGLFKEAREGKPSGPIFTLFMPIISNLAALPILLIPIFIIQMYLLINPSFYNVYGFQLDLILNTGAIIIFYFLIVKYKEKRSIASIGFKLNKSTLYEYLSGFLIGILLIGIIAILIVITGNGSFESNKNIDLSFVGPFILVIIGWCIQGASEEIMMRGHMMPVLGNRFGPISGILISSSYFGALHLLNNGISVLAIVNLILFGIFASVFAIYKRSLWGVCALHSAWNFAQGNLFGFLVSGIKTNGGQIITTKITEGNIINGGNFGPEGGLITSVILILAILVVSYLLKRKNKA
ncbi:type II CAAX endopeptidase family protein [Clostridium baratii]|uniref:CPBP family intramembrane glutamic endopeptidase n=1 Tax=Clostridium baratii TaxID=1561 RepID=UPI002912B0C5|nr:type II CAAX endopeptidase family protein [Clostridium baratii]MDU4911363.1 type II CAAX endopeptidase family protein [Clostridium baratii]